jgi:hypothetical protein
MANGERPSSIFKAVAADLREFINSGSILAALLVLGLVQVILPPLLPILFFALILMGGLYLAGYLLVVARELIQSKRR